MKKSGLTLTLIICGLLFNINAWSQIAGDQIILQVNWYKLIESNYAPVSLSLTSSTAGAAIAPVSNSDLFIKYSAIKPRWFWWYNYSVNVSISSGSVPAGTELSILSAACTTANSGGQVGTPKTTPIILSSSGQTIISGIGSCYTGSGNNDGHQMTFTWYPKPSGNYSLIESATTNIIVTFTIQ